MNREELKRKAKELEIKMNARRNEAYFLDVMSWLSYLGLLRNNFAKPKRVSVTLTDALRAAEVEPRIFELLPAILVRVPEAFKFKKADIPEDLDKVVKSIKKKNSDLKPYNGVSAEKYLFWVKSEAMEVARRKLFFRTAPRQRKNKPTDIGVFIRDSRMKLALTQEELAMRVDVSVRIIRDLEQGRLSASIANVNKVLGVFAARLKIG